MNLYEKLLAKEEKLSLVGLGYVGMPIAVAFSKSVDVIGFDLYWLISFLNLQPPEHLEITNFFSTRPLFSSSSST